ncbi:hypothetical protein TNIN_250841 [Trichonephila inaurata madagascariensis]|uniref:Uncharacterized protein n=1 Tax=Trichonephila inaurata madagascariensis TaxID=2747483 RepID=A0A8X6XR72_9ARAC|nr:hypothetical protein TNIN_250841 [Trichonephila inaurata madagascariensis]
MEQSQPMLQAERFPGKNGRLGLGKRFNFPARIPAKIPAASLHFSFFFSTNNVTRRETKSNDNKELSYYIEKGSVLVNRHRDKGWWCFNESGSVGGRPGVHFVILPEWVTQYVKHQS